METQLTPQEAFNNLTRALNFLKPLVYASESLKTYMDTMKEKETLDKQLEEYKRIAEQWKKKMEEDEKEWKAYGRKIQEDYMNAAKLAIKDEEAKLAKLKENIEKEKSLAKEDLTKLQEQFIAKKYEQDAEFVKLGLAISQKKIELENIGKTILAKTKEMEEQVKSHSLLREQLVLEKEKVEKDYMEVVEKLEAIKRAARALIS